MINLFFSLITDFIFVSLFENEKLINELYESNYCLHSENFVSKLSVLLKNNNLTLKSIDSIFFLSGPGGQTGERVSFSFVTAMKILNPDLKAFFLDSLKFQIGTNLNCLSIVTVGQSTKKYYVDIYKNGRIYLKKERVGESELREIKNNFKHFSSITDFENVKFSSLFLSLKSTFLPFNEF